jgi:hypothetical protein
MIANTFASLGAVALMAAGAGQAAYTGAIGLHGPNGEPAPDVQTVQNVTGECGLAVVRILGVQAIEPEFFTVDADSAVIVRPVKGPERRLTIESGLSDHNGIACAEARDGSERILIWFDCAGFGCGHGWGFTVIDPADGSTVSPPDCDSECAAHLVDSDLPLDLAQKNAPAEASASDVP